MLILTPSLLDQLRRHGEETYPHECCGVLLGSFEGEDRRVLEVIRCGNTRDDRPQDRYHIDPRELVRIQRQGRERSLDIVGFYHSHPDHPARWSQTDAFLLSGSVEEDKKFVEEELCAEQGAKTLGD
jgi:proteasome lid subunit RPN8/RPN11